MFTSDAKAATTGIPGARKMKKVDEGCHCFLDRVFMELRAFIFSAVKEMSTFLGF